jgi:hypothetical protein
MRALIIGLLNAHSDHNINALFPIDSKFNHDCRPSARYEIIVDDEGQPWLSYYALRPIFPNEPILLSYLLTFEL